MKKILVILMSFAVIGNIVSCSPQSSNTSSSQKSRKLSPKKVIIFNKSEEIKNEEIDEGYVEYKIEGIETGVNEIDNLLYKQSYLHSYTIRMK